MGQQPSGTVTLVFTDVEGSTRLLHELGQAAYRQALADHRETIRSAFARFGGYEVDYEGDSFFYAFQTATAAVSAVEQATAALGSGPIRVRVGLHTGEPGLDPPKYVGMDVHRAARIMACAHGGQVVLSQATRELLDRHDGLRDLGEHRLKDLAAPIRLYQLGEGEFPPLRSLYRTNVPVPATSFLGLEQELVELVALLDRNDLRVLTLTGPGGTGKTRLALQAAAEAAESFPDGIWWVPLAALRDPELVLSAVAQALELKEQPGRELRATLADRLAGKETLLLLDNAEHLLPAAVHALAALRDIPGPVVLVTSRERLQVEGEHSYPVPTMQRPDAVALFEARMRQLGGESTDESVISELCARLDDLPLAVELAAARTTLLAPDQLLDRLGQRLDLLKGARDADPRQRTLRATIDWSYELLEHAEQQVLRALSVFAGGCTLEAAEAVSGASIDTLQSLVDKSLLRRRESESGVRYWMLETIREYAAERLEQADEAERLRRRHAEHVLAFLEDVEPRLERGGEQMHWLQRLDADAANAIEAVRWARETGEAEIELRLATASWRYWHIRGRLSRGRSWLEEALAHSDPSPGALRAHALNRAAFLANRQGDDEAAQSLAEEGLAISTELGEPAIGARSLLILAGLASRRGELDRSLPLLDESAALARQAQDNWGLGNALAVRAGTLLTDGLLDEAAPLLDEAIALMRSIDDLGGTALHVGTLGLLELRRGHYEAAKAHLEESLQLSTRLDYKEGITLALERLAYMELATDGDAVHAARLLGNAHALRQEMGLTALLLDELHATSITAARERLGEPRFSEAWTEGEATARDELSGVALSQESVNR